MSFRPRSATLPLLLLLAANAASVLFFRFFNTLDGPMHVLHACALKSAWFSGRYATPQVDYSLNLGSVDLGDVLLVPLTFVLSPVAAHLVYVTAVLFVLGAGWLYVVRSTVRPNWALCLWVLPLSFCFVLVLGFLTFLLATGLALLGMGWWMRQPRITWGTILRGSLIAAACQATHRSGASLALLCMGSYELVLFVRDRSAWWARWSSLPGWWRVLIPLAGALYVVYKVGRTALTQPRLGTPAEGDFWLGFFELRPLLLMDAGREHPYLLALGILFLATMVAAIVHRFRDQSAPIAADAVLLVAFVLLVTSVVIRTPNFQLLYVGVRAQTVALMLFAAWAAMSLPGLKWTVALGALVLITHVARLLRIERHMAGSADEYQLAMKTVGRLPLHGVALPVMRDDNWLHEHLPAYVAAAYEGVFFSPQDHLGFRYRKAPSQHLRDYSNGFQHQLTWLDEHVASGAEPVIDHVVLFGNGRPQDGRMHAIMSVLEHHYFPQWRNEYAEVWVRNEAP